MFNNLGKLGYRRSVLEAVGFYIAYLVLFIVVGGIAGMLAGIVLGHSNSFEGGFNVGVKVGWIAAILLSLILAFLVVKEKKLLSNFGFIFLILLSGILAACAGGLGGLIPVAYLTTRQPNIEPEKSEGDFPSSDNTI